MSLTYQQVVTEKRDGLKIEFNSLLVMVVERLDRDDQGWSGMKLGCVYVSVKEEYRDYEINPKF